MNLTRLCEAGQQASRYIDSEIRLLLGREIHRPGNAAQALAQWRAAMVGLRPVRGRILITALRNATWIEWAVYCACVIRRLGFETTLVFDGEQIRKLYPRRTLQRDFWSAVKEIPGIELIDLRAQAVAADVLSQWRAVAEEWAPVALAYDLHVEEHDVCLARETHASRWTEFVCRAAMLAAGLERFLRSCRFHRAFCYSGLIGESKLLLDVLRAADVETVCLEGWAWRPGHMIYNLNAAALEYNVAGWMHSLGEWDEAKEAEVNAYLKFLDGNRSEDSDWLNNFYRIQRDNISASMPEGLRQFLQGDAPVFLLAPNVIGDSSTLRRETIFPSMQVWTEEVVRWFAARPHLKLIIRAHPAERWIGAKCVIFMGEVARRAAQSVPNVFVIDSGEPLNTFSLLPFAQVGLVWLSSAGVDFVVRGLPTIVAAKPKYTGLGIAEEPETREAYFRLLERWAAQPHRPSLYQITQGKRYLHMVFRGFSFEAGARNFRATQLRVGQMPNQDEHDRFYSIIVGDEPMPDVE